MSLGGMHEIHRITVSPETMPTNLKPTICSRSSDLELQLIRRRLEKNPLHPNAN